MARASSSAGALRRSSRTNAGSNSRFERRDRSARESVSVGAVVGADGAQSAVAQAAGWPRQPTVPLIQAVVKLPSGMPPDTVRVWFIPDDTPYFYWLIPESADRGVLGLIGVDGQETRRCLDLFLEKRHFTPLAFQGARIPVYNGWVPVERKLGQGTVYLVGDAAGQVKVSTVGGVVTGFRGALGVSQAILNGGRSRELRALRRELDLHLLIRRSIHRFQPERLQPPGRLDERRHAAFAQPRDPRRSGARSLAHLPHATSPPPGRTARLAQPHLACSARARLAVG